MAPRVVQSLVAALIRIGLLIALVIMLIVENHQSRALVIHPVAVPASASMGIHGQEGAESIVPGKTYPHLGQFGFPSSFRNPDF